MTRVLFVDQSQVLGGAELSLIDICQRIPGSAVAVFAEGAFSERLRSLSIDCRILSVPDGLLSVKRGGGIISEVLAVPALLAASYGISRLAKDFDVIYANTQKAMLAGAFGGKLARKPVIWHLRDLMTDDHFGRKIIAASTAVANNFVDKVIANSRATQGAFVTAGGDEAKTVMIHNGIDGREFSEVSPDTLDRLRSEFNVRRRKVAGIFSRISNWKGQHLLIEAIANHPDWDALIVGDALFQNDHEYKAELLAMVTSANLRSRVHFCGFRDDVPALMSMCDVVVHASTSPEPFGRVIVEGMLARTPVIAANGGGASEIVRHGENGFLFDPAVPGSLTDVLSFLNSTDVSEMVAVAHDEASTYYSVDRLIDEVLVQIRSTVGGKE